MMLFCLYSLLYCNSIGNGTTRCRTLSALPAKIAEAYVLLLSLLYICIYIIIYSMPVVGFLDVSIKPKSAISVMMITAYIFEQMSLRFEGAMGFHCN